MAGLSRRAQRRARGRAHGGPREFASFGHERERIAPKRRGGGDEYNREKVDDSAEREGAALAEMADEDRQPGQGFGIGAGRGVESSSGGLEGQRLEERDYRGNAGVTFGAPMGPDALKEDTSQAQREDPKPEK